MLKLNYRYQAWVLFEGQESISCTIKFKDKLHANIPIDSNQISLNQWCNSTLNEGSCNYWKKSACDDTGDCMQKKQESQANSYVRCGIKRPFYEVGNPLRPGDVISFKAGFNVYDDQGALKNWGEMQSWAKAMVAEPPK